MIFESFFKKTKPYYIIDNFLPSLIVDKLLSDVKQAQFRTARQFDQGRKNKELFIDSLIYLDEYILNKKIGAKKIQLFSKPYEFYKYEIDDFIAKHKDASTKLSNAEFSNYTLLIYLNDEFVGGETLLIEEDIKYVPKKGSALLFEHSLEHSAEKLLFGEKYIFRTNCLLK